MATRGPRASSRDPAQFLRIVMIHGRLPNSIAPNNRIDDITALDASFADKLQLTRVVEHIDVPR
jgi:hypothetical protein